MYPKISIIIATHNRPKLLKKTLISLECQSFRDFEVLVCNDAGDRQAEIITKGFNKDFSIHYFWCKDKGGYCWAAAKNTGAKKAKGEYLLFMDDDILLPSDAVEKMYMWLISSAGRKEKFYVVPQARIYVKADIPDDLVRHAFGEIKKYSLNFSTTVSVGCTGMIYKNNFHKVHGFDEILFVGMQLGDTDFVKRLKGFLNVEGEVLPINVYHLDNDSFRYQRDIIACKRKLIAKKLINEKLEMMGFELKNGLPIRKYSNEYYENLLMDKRKLDKISWRLRKQMKLYDQPVNYKKIILRK